MSIDKRRMNLGYDILDPCKVKVKKGGSAFIPTLQGGDFPLRPLHPRKLKRWRRTWTSSEKILM